MSATARTVRPFAMLVGEGWSRDAAARLLDEVREKRFEVRSKDGSGNRLLCDRRLVGISVSRDCHEPGNAPFNPEATRSFVETVLETLLMRSEEEALHRITKADSALDTAARLSEHADTLIMSGQISAYARGRYGRAMFGRIVKSHDNWTSTMRPDEKRRDLPFCLSVDITRSRMTIWKRTRTIHNVDPLSTLERLRMEAVLAEDIAHMKAMDAP